MSTPTLVQRKVAKDVADRAARQYADRKMRVTVAAVAHEAALEALGTTEAER